MANGPLSPAMLIASNGLMVNPSFALIANTDLSNSISTYRNYVNVSNVVSAALNVNVVANANIISDATFTSLVTMGNATVPPLGDAIVANIANTANSISNTATFTQVVEDLANDIMGNGDLSIFAQVYGMSYGYLKQTNTYINSANNTEIIGATFTSMDALTTGGLSQVSNDVSVFGKDLAAIGTTIDLSRLQYLGHPWVLLRQMLQAGGLLPDVYNALVSSGMSDQDISSIQNNKTEISAELDLKIYNAFSTITGNALSQVCLLLDVAFTTAEKLSTAADLLNPKKLLPNSWQTLITQIPSGTATVPTESLTVNIYNGSSGQVSSQVLDFYKIDPTFLGLSRIIPPDQAAANLAWARSFYQIKNIINLKLPDVAASSTAVESNAGLPFIESLNGLTGPVPTDIKDQIFSDLGTGSGENGLLSLDDFMGVVSGTPWVSDVGNLNAEIANVSGYTEFTDITGTYTIMIDMLNGDYGDPVVGPIILPGDPTPYGNADQALQPLIANAITNIAVFQSTYPTASSNLVTTWDAMASQFEMENNNLALAGVKFNELQTSRPAIMNLGTSLHSIGTDPDASPFFSSIANIGDNGGQAVIAGMREGRNIDVLGKAGVGTDTQLPSD